MVERNKKINRIILLFLCISFFQFFIRLYFLHPTFSDETFYFNVAKEFSQGKTLYKDFFFAHSPLQIYLIALFFKIFGVSFFVGKLIPLIFSSLDAILIFLIGKKLAGERVGIIAFLFFFFFPSFLSFSLLEIGVWEAMFFLLFSLYFLLEEKLFLSSIFFSISLFFRYLVIFYFPFLLILVLILRKNAKKYFIFSLLTSFLLFSFFLLLYGKNLFIQTVLFHFYKLNRIAYSQYFQVGYFSLFLSLVSAFVLHKKKNKVFFLFSLVPLIADSFLLIIFSFHYYHYFLFSLPFCILATSAAFVFSKNKIAKAFILLILIFSVLFNLQTIDFYLNPLYAHKFYLMVDLVEKNAGTNETIFGEPVATNFISFVTNRKIAGNYLDSYPFHLKFEGYEKVLSILKEEKPKVLIGMKVKNESYFPFEEILKDYELEKVIEGVPTYFLFKRK